MKSENGTYGNCKDGGMDNKHNQRCEEGYNLEVDERFVHKVTCDLKQGWASD